MKMKKITGGGATNGIGARQIKKFGLLYLIMLFMCTVVICRAFISPSDLGFCRAYAAVTDIELGELTLRGYAETDEYKIFDGVRLKKLYDAILGEEGTGTLERVENALLGNDGFYYHTLTGFNSNSVAQQVTLYNGLSSKDIRNLNGGKDIYLDLGGITWAVTYLTKADNGHVILDLWQTQASFNCAFSGGEGGSAWYATGNGDPDNLPCQIYGTSLIRSVGLNAGTDYCLYNSVGLDRQSAFESGEQDEDSPYAAFTMEGVKSSLTDFLVKPSQVKYQEIESYAGECGQLSTSYFGEPNGYFVLSNDAYGTPWKENYFKFYRTEADGTPREEGEFYVNTGYGCAGENVKNGYADWKNDFLWLPSLTETGGGNSINGIWDLSDGQRSGNESCWLRSGAQSFANSVYYIDEYGNAVESDCNPNTAYKLGVRPALHLDLTEADGAAGIAMPLADDTRFVYNGTPQTYNPKNFDSEAMSVSGNIQTDADGYEVEVASKLEYKFANGEMELKFDFVIEKADPEVNPYQAVEKPFVTEAIQDVVALSHGDTEGRLFWDSQTPIAGVHEYVWEFIPADTKNYNSKSGEIELNFRAPSAIGISAELIDSGESIYSTLSLENLREKITVNLNYDNGASKELGEFALFAVGGKLAVGENSITVRTTVGDKIFECELIINVLQAEIIGIDVAFAQDGACVYFDTSLESLKNLKNADNENVLKVYADWNDGAKKVPVNDYYLTFKSGECFHVGVTIVIITCGGCKEELEVNVIKKDYDTSGWRLENDMALYDGHTHNISYSGLPECVSAEFYLDGEIFVGATEAGVYNITVKFINGNPNYNEAAEASATLIIARKCYPVPTVEKVREYEAGGVDFTPAGMEEYLEFLEFSVDGKTVNSDCFKITEIGNYRVTVRLKSDLIFFEDFTDSVKFEFSLVKRIVGTPKFSGKLYYTGNRISPSVELFDNFDGSVMRLNIEASQSGKDAGEYTAVFVLADNEHYGWSAASLTNNGEARVLWKISRSVVYAERSNGGMPVLKSESYKGSFENVVAYSYFSDADCLNEIRVWDLREGESYFVIAELIDTDNFEVSSESVQLFSKPFVYTVQDKNALLRKSVDKLIAENKVLFALTGVSLSLTALLLISLGVLSGLAIRNKRKTK